MNPTFETYISFPDVSNLVLTKNAKLEYATSIIHLKYPLLVVKARCGVVVCGYFNLAAFEETEEAAVMVTGVRNIDDVLKAKVVGFTSAAASLGISEQDTGESALSKMQ